MSVVPRRKAKSRDYELERRRLDVQLEECSDGHPLQALVTVSGDTPTVWVSSHSM